MTSRLAPLAVVAAVATALALSACAPSGAPTPTPSPPSASASSTPTETDTPTPAVSPEAGPSIPEDCGAVGTAATRATTVDQMNLQGDGTGFVRPAPAGAALLLGCDWIVGDATGFLLLINDVDPAAAAAYVATDLPAAGYSCSAGEIGGQVCTMSTDSSEFPVATVETIVSRDGVWIYTSATNTNGVQLLAELQEQIWDA